jgi:hypothetical protein
MTIAVLPLVVRVRLGGELFLSGAALAWGVGKSGRASRARLAIVANERERERERERRLGVIASKAKQSSNK